MTGKLRLKTESVDLVSVIEAAIDTVSSAAFAKKIRIERKLDSSVQPVLGDSARLQQDVWNLLSNAVVQPVLGDSARLQQVVWNLLSNAIKFTPERGHIEVRLEFTNSHAQIRVSDTGVGINTDILPYVFDMFGQVDDSSRKPGGFGLGLRTVRYLVELHGGTVHAESPGVGQGATFIVNLPIRKFFTRLEASFHE
jgi:signal transduction histidine kinase